MIVKQISKIYQDPRFKRLLLKMPAFVQRAFLEKEFLIRTDIFHPSLETHKLHGKYKKYYALTITGQYRFLFEFLADDQILLINIGTHEIYR